MVLGVSSLYGYPGHIFPLPELRVKFYMAPQAIQESSGNILAGTCAGPLVLNPSGDCTPRSLGGS